MANDVDLDQIAKDLAGLTGADLSAMMNEASLMAARDRSDVIQQKHMLAAIRRMTTGVARRPLSRDLENARLIRKRLALCEVARALVALALRELESSTIEDVEYVSMIPTGADP